tara:strand:+ start:236 stop:697 length:462 start_codon:yes stop_codon:yes gene_type:complete
MISWLIRKYKTRKQRQHHDKVIKDYRTFAASLGDAISYAHMGSVSFSLFNKSWSLSDPETYHKLDELEEQYAELGYRIVSVDDWVDYAGWGVNIDHLWLVKRDEDERPVFSKNKQKRELPEPSPLLDMVMKTGKAHEQVMNDEGEMEIRQVED